MEKKRIEFIDLAKGFCILLVVFNHIHKTFDTQFLLDDCFKMLRMPLYFFLSGLFFKKYEGVVGFMKRKMNKLLIPFVFFFLLTSFLIPNIIFLLSGNIFKIELLWSFVNPEFFPNFPIWFLWCLFELNLMFYVVYLIAEKFGSYNALVMTILSLTIGYFGYYLGRVNYNLYCFADSAMSAFPFFYFGFITREHPTILQPNKLDKYNIPIAFALFLFTFMFARHVDYSTNTFGDVPFLIVYGCGLTGVFSIIFLSKAIKKLPYISYIGRYSIMLLCTHFIIVTYLNSFLRKFISSDWTIMSINLVVTISLYSIIIPFMKKYMPHVTAQKDVIKI